MGYQSHRELPATKTHRLKRNLKKVLTLSQMSVKALTSPVTPSLTFSGFANKSSWSTALDNIKTPTPMKSTPNAASQAATTAVGCNTPNTAAIFDMLKTPTTFDAPTLFQAQQLTLKKTMFSFYQPLQ